MGKNKKLLVFTLDKEMVAYEELTHGIYFPPF